MTGLFSTYAPGRAWDEMFGPEGTARAPYHLLYGALDGQSSVELKRRADLVARSYIDQGVTFDLGGVERPFPLDIVPRIVTAQEWAPVATGVPQRVRALEAFLADVYGPRRAVADGVIPAGVITSSTNFLRQAWGFTPPGGVRIHVSGTDCIRDEQGDWRVLEDNVRIPSGVSYVLSNRRAISQLYPSSLTDLPVQPVSDYPAMLLAALRASAPDGVDDPTVVVLTPGVYNSAYFEHTLLARLMGVELVEGRDLFCSHGRVYMRTTRGSERVDVIYRRVDDEWLDPVTFRSDSVLGCPGILSAARAGGVTIANAVGNGVADDKLLYTYVPDLIRYYLHEEPILHNVQTWRLEEPGALQEVLDRLDELVVKPVDGSGGKGIVIGPAATKDELATLRAKLLHDPRGWIAQPVVQLSTAPTWVGNGLRPRHVDLRPFAVNIGGDVQVLPGGLTRVALPEGQLVVNSSQGGGSKDTWVLADQPASAGPSQLVIPDEASVVADEPAVSAPVMEHQEEGPHGALDEEFEPQHQQQQQQGRQDLTGGAPC